MNDFIQYIEGVQGISALLGGLMNLPYLLSASQNLAQVHLNRLNGTRTLIAQKEVRIAQVMLVIQILLLLLGIASFLYDVPEYIPPMTRMVTSLLLGYVAYKNWTSIVPLHTRRRTDECVPVPGALDEH